MGYERADTFRRVFERINPKQLEQCLEQWVGELVDELGIQVIAIDGKSLRGSYDRESGTKALHLVSAWATEHRLVLAQSKVQDKSNEITAIPALLELLDILRLYCHHGCDGDDRYDCGSDSAGSSRLHFVPPRQSSHPVSTDRQLVEDSPCPGHLTCAP